MDASTTAPSKDLQQTGALFRIVEAAFREIASQEAGKILNAEVVTKALENQLQGMILNAVRDSMPQIKDLMLQDLNDMVDNRVDREVERTVDDKVDRAMKNIDFDEAFSDKTFTRRLDDHLDDILGDKIGEKLANVTLRIE